MPNGYIKSKNGTPVELVDATARSKMHEHENKDLLDEITEERMSSWDAGGGGSGGSLSASLDDDGMILVKGGGGSSSPVDSTEIVKQALCNPSSEGWTPSEQEASRERQGIYIMTQEEYDLLDVTVDNAIYVIVDGETL